MSTANSHADPAGRPWSAPDGSTGGPAGGPPASHPAAPNGQPAAGSVPAAEGAAPTQVRLAPPAPQPSWWSGGQPAQPVPAEQDRPGLAREVLLALGVTVTITLLGFPLGWLWSVAGPWTPVQMTSDGAVLSAPEQEQMIADEGWYLGITVLTGIVLTALAWGLLRRYRGVPMALGLALGSTGAGVVAWRFGRSIGLDHFRYLLQHAAVGSNFSKPVDLRVAKIGMWHGILPYARGDVLAMAIAAAVIYLLLAGFSPHPSLRAPRILPESPEPEPEVTGEPVAGGPGPAAGPADRPAVPEQQVSSGS